MLMAAAYDNILPTITNLLLSSSYGQRNSNNAHVRKRVCRCKYDAGIIGNKLVAHHHNRLTLRNNAQ